MKTQSSILAIAIQATLYIGLIALLGLILALAYAVQSFLAAPISEPLTTPAPVSAPAISAAKPVLAEAKAAPNLNDDKDYAKMTTRELRPLARDRKIPNWKKLNKNELIAALSA